MRTLLALLICVFAMAAQAANYYVSTTGSGDGSIGSPWSLATALNSGSVQPGDTVWIRGGTYNSGVHLPMLGINIQLSGNATNQVTIRPYNRERVIINGYFQITGDYVTVRDLEFTDLSNPSAGPATFATRAAFEAALAASSYPYAGISAEGDHDQVINCLIYDCWFATTGNGPNEWHGNIVVNVGAVFDDDSTIGEGLYGQNGQVADGLYATYEQNIYSMGPRNGLNLWAAGSGYVARMNVKDNMTLFLSTVVRSGAEGQTVGDVFLTNNVVADTSDASRDYPALLGFGFSNISVTNAVSSSNLVINGTLNIKNTGASTFIGNTICAVNNVNNAMLIIDNSGNLNLSSNSYFCAAANNRVAVDSTVYTFPNYTNATGWDVSSTFTQANFPAANRILYFTNKYEPGRMHIFVANFQSNDVVSLDLSGKGLATGQAYEIRYVNNYFGPKITGVYAGQLVTLPMTNWTVAQPRWLTVARAGGSNLPLYTEPTPTWGAFVVIQGQGGRTLNVTDLRVGGGGQ